MKRLKKDKKVIIGGIVIIVLLLIGLGIYNVYSNNQTQTKKEKEVEKKDAAVKTNIDYLTITDESIDTSESFYFKARINNSSDQAVDIESLDITVSDKSGNLIHSFSPKLNSTIEAKNYMEFSWSVGQPSETLKAKILKDYTTKYKIHLKES